MIGRKLTIGHFQSGYPESDGITAAVHGMSAALVEAGHRVVIYGYGRSHAGTGMKVPAGLEVVTFDAPRNPFFTPRALRDRLRRNTDGLDLLVIHGMFNPPNIVIARWAELWQIPYIVCPHCPYDPLMLSKSRLRKAVYGALFEKPALRRALAVQVFSRRHADLLLQYGIITPTIEVPNGFNPEELPDYEVSGAPLLSGDPKLLFLGRIDSHHKGLDLLIEGFAAAFHRGSIPSTTVLTIVGPDSGDARALRRIVEERKVSSQVVFTGRAVDPKRWLMLKSCDMFVLGSRYDGFAMAVTEAMMAGKPLLISDAAANSDWIREASCATIVEPSVEGISAGLAEAISRRREWAAMGERAKSFASSKLTWSRAAASAVDQYLQLLDPAAWQTDEKRVLATAR